MDSNILAAITGAGLTGLGVGLVATAKLWVDARSKKSAQIETTHIESKLKLIMRAEFAEFRTSLHAELLNILKSEFADGEVARRLDRVEGGVDLIHKQGCRYRAECGRAN